MHKKAQNIAASHRLKEAAVPVAAVLSFLKETKSLATWSVSDMARSLKISTKAARDLLPIMQMQGYIQPEGRRAAGSAQASQWSTTAAGYDVSGAKMPRLKRETVESAVQHLKDWIAVVNKDDDAQFTVTEAVAFGDFMRKELTRVQAADVGVRLVPRNGAENGSREKQNQQQIPRYEPLWNVSEPKPNANQQK